VETDLRALIQAVADTLRPRAESEGVALTVRTDATPLRAWVDGGQIQLVVRNVLMNAIEAAAEGAADGRSVQLTLDAAAGPGVRVTVDDSGAGIPPALAEKIFEPFYTSKANGMGMGLAISRAIAQAHGGTLAAEPGPHGRVVLVLPVATPRGA
jgi:signal transduction histidine kinase